MSEPKYEIGYRRPPKAHQFVKGQSPNPAGPRRKMPSTWSNTVEQVLMETIQAPEGGGSRYVTVLELILLQLVVKVAAGNKKALRIFRKYEDYAKTKPAVKNYTPDPYAYGDMLEAEERGLDVRAFVKERKRERNERALLENKNEVTEKKSDVRRKIEAHIARARAGLEPPIIDLNMTAREACEMYELSLKIPVPPPRKRRRKTKTKNLQASEIFERVMYGVVTIKEGEKLVAAPRMQRAIRSAASRAIRGDLGCAEQLMDIHAHSLKHGDFYVRPKYIPR